MSSGVEKRIGILVVAYNAASTLAKVLDRIPKEFRSQISQVLVSDDHSQDSTYLVGLGYQQLSELPITVIRQPYNLGYGGNQKAGYEMAIANGLDIVVLLHGDGQYAPECLPDIVAPLIRDEADAVFGSRMMIKGAARKGGMPLYKYLGNKILSRIENATLGTELSEFHSGYRAYSTHTLQQIPFHKNSNGFNFDTQIIIQLHDAGKRIVEVPIPTFYGDEICYVNGLGYAFDVIRDVIAYRLNKAGLGGEPRTSLREEPTSSGSVRSSTDRIVSLLSSRAPSKILDLRCSDGSLAQRLQMLGHYVTGVDSSESAGVRERTGSFVLADLNEGIPSEAGRGFDIVLGVDLLEHMSEPSSMLRHIHSVVRSDGSVVIRVPNVAHWYPRIRSLLGVFDYDRRGILDHTNLRFFTRRSIRQLSEEAGFRVLRLEATGLPFGMLMPNLKRRRLLRAIETLLISARPTLFGYQFVLELVPDPDQAPR